MTKSLHAGRACQSGLLAALLAERGFTANPNAIEAQQGFAAVSGGGRDADAALADGWHLRENLFKHHASCFFTHSDDRGAARAEARAAVRGWQTSSRSRSTSARSSWERA